MNDREAATRRWVARSIAALFGAAAMHAAAVTFVVKNVNDAGPGSLRQAIIDANDKSATDVAVITFKIPGAGPLATVHTIAPKSALPPTIRTVNLDATTQPGYSGVPVIEISGKFAGPSANGLTIAGSGSIVRGFAINRFAGHGIVLSSGGNVIDRCFIGTDITGQSARHSPRLLIGSRCTTRVLKGILRQSAAKASRS